MKFHLRVGEWVKACFGLTSSKDPVERRNRFGEDAIEMVQACGMPKEDLLKLVDYVYGRQPSTPRQEVGGVMTTLAALCYAHGLDMGQLAEEELASIWTRIPAIRAKHASKPRDSPLPGDYPKPDDPVVLPERAPPRMIFPQTRGAVFDVFDDKLISYVTTPADRIASQLAGCGLRKDQDLSTRGHGHCQLCGGDHDPNDVCR